MNREEFHDLFVQTPAPIQSEDELWWIWNRIKDRIKPLETVIEIGLSGGGSLRFWRELVPQNGLLIGIDRENAVHNWDSKGRQTEIVIGYSEDISTINRIKEILKDKKVDFLYIDGHHEWFNVSSDYNNYSPFVRKGGVIGFHDTGTEHVNKLFESIKGEKERISIAHGTGILFL